ncbi:exopolysaccharide biosynthesis polyprenyl glycosylphosphotransferase [Pseudoalteromonas lipolytica]|uniref:Exopolysaccharide biosynthesis protein n=1 Tax=Pseudoalteromonas lipolytica TaxID=570156 RepID=A0A0P7E2K4_9GAMM|nr:exopolysaccharide biosynthesis polyprenyl glycosylphosphotransferase [Pseudoalteromonas lipolytica]KPM84258.1 exopolysaccharide biosynthesis protein [Pseudoalteromonas lipolytica]
MFQYKFNEAEDGSLLFEQLKKGRSVKAPKYAYCSDTVYVYCPESKLNLLKNSLKEYNVNFIFNDYSLVNLDKKIITHFDNSMLSEEKRSFLVTATELGAWVEPLVSYLDKRMGYTEVTLLQSSYFLHQKAFSILNNKRTQVSKRIIDLLLATFLILLFSPIALVVYILIRLDSPGPAIYKQKRVGQYNEEFKIIKFRSMRIDAEHDGAKWAKENDDRVTKIGHFIRKTRIDEIPQLINVIRGEMSMVGPRPEREVFIEQLEESIPYYRFRHAVKPGVTGLAQIRYPYGASLDDAIWKHKYDIHYIKHHSTLHDLKIIFKTIKVVILGMGR